jgi:Cyclic nucleotide-binding domain/Major Facilitator Superfamily
LRTAAQALGAVLRNRDLRRAEAAFALFVAAELGSWVAILVYAYRQGGTTEAGIVAAVQLGPAGALAPLTGAAADRFGGVVALVGGYAAQCLAMTGTGVALVTGAPWWAVYVLAAAAAIAVTATRPTQALVSPMLARSPIELGAVNVLSGWITAAMALAAPALVGVVLTLGGPGIAFLCAAGATGIAALLATSLPRARRPGAGESLRGVVRDLLAGFGVVRSHRSIRLIVSFIGGLAMLGGAIDVLAVTLALGELGLGAGGPGYLTAAFGAGGLVGAALGLSLVGRRRLVPHFGAAALGCGVALVVLGLWPSVAAAFLLLGAAGAGTIVFGVAAEMLLQRTAPTDVLSRVFGVAEGFTNLGWALGSLAVPALDALGGVRTTLIAIGALLPVMVLLRLRALVSVDAAADVPVVEISLLRSMPMFALLPPRELEGLARSLTPLEVPAGTRIIEEGEIGDRFYAIADGTVDVVASGRFVARLGRGEGVGEIALLRGVPRTATVTASSNVRLQALDREAFLVALTGHAATHGTMQELADARLEELRALAAVESELPS